MSVMRFLRYVLAAGVLLGLVGCESEGERKKRLDLVGKTTELREVIKGIPGVSKELPEEEVGERHDVRFYRFLFEMPEEVQVREVKWRGREWGHCLTVEGSDMWLMPSVIGQSNVCDLDEGGEVINELIAQVEVEVSDEDLVKLTLEALKERHAEALGKFCLLVGCDEGYEVYRAANGNMALVLLGWTPKEDEYFRQEFVRVYLDGAIIYGQIPASTPEQREAFLKAIMTRTSLRKGETWTREEWWKKDSLKYVRRGK